MWERFLYTTALLSLVLVLFIFSNHDVSGLTNPSLFFHQSKSKKQSVEQDNKRIVSFANVNSSQEIQESLDVYPQDVMNVIDSYYNGKEKHKELAEEEKRLLSEENEEGGEDEKTSANKTLTKEHSTFSPAQKQKSVAFKIVRHTVQKGDSLWSIAREYHVPLYTVTSANPKLKDKMIYLGESVQVPNKAGLMYKVKKGNSLSWIAEKYKTTVEQIIVQNHLSNNEIYPNQVLFLPNATPLPLTQFKKVKMFVMPLHGRITSGYGWRQHPILNKRAFHYGIDIAAKYGTAIKAAADGVVIFSGDGGTYGNMVVLKHKYNYISIYAHCSKLYVKKGKYVKQGKKIAAIGSTGLSTGPHLHFEVKQNRKAINPKLALQKTIQIAVKAN